MFGKGHKAQIIKSKHLGMGGPFATHVQTGSEYRDLGSYIWKDDDGFAFKDDDGFTFKDD